MTCREATGFLSDYVAGELAPAVLADFERHLGRCPNCVRFLDQYRDTIAASRRAELELDDDVAAALPEELVQAVIAAVKPLRRN